MTTNDMLFSLAQSTDTKVTALVEASASHDARLEAIENHIGAGSAFKRGLVMTAISSATALAIFHAGRIVPLIPTP